MPGIQPFQFKHLTTLGFIPRAVAVSPSTFAKPRIDTWMRAHMSKHNIDDRFGFPTTHLASFYRRIVRGDLPPFNPEIPGPVLRFAFDLVKQACGGSAFAPIESLTFDLDTAAGHPFNGMTKREVLNAYPELLREVAYAMFGAYEVYYKATPKTNELVAYETMALKGPRIFYSTPLLRLIEEKIVWELQNKKFNIGSRVWGGVIGLNFGDGNWHDIMQKHAKYKYHIAGDSLAQDLSTTLMAAVYMLRRACLVIPPGCEAFVDYLIKTNIFPKVVLLNGQVLQFTRIGLSGNNNITQDNTIAYAILLLWVFYLIDPINFIVIWLECMISLYGDDWLVSTNDIRLTNPDVWHHAWKLVDMKLKFLRISEDLTEMSFLGSLILRKEYYGQVFYCRAPERKKVLASLLYLPRSMSLQEKYERLLCFCQLYVHTKFFTLIYDALLILGKRLAVRVPPQTLFLHRDLGLQGGHKNV